MALLLDDIPWLEPVAPRNLDRASLELCKKYMGIKLKPLALTGWSPWLGRALVTIVSWRPKHVDQRLFDIADFVASQENVCRYCYGAARARLRLQGYSDALISRLEREAALPDDPSAEVVARFSRRLARADPRPSAAAYGDLRQGDVSEDAAREILYTVTLTTFANRVTTLLAAEPEQEYEAMADRLSVRLLRPLRRWTARQLGHPAPPHLRAHEYEGPFSPLVQAMVGSPAADVVAGALDLALAEGHLPVRTKFLMLAVIARAIGCTACEEEAAREARASGFDDATVAEALDHLDADRLNDTERALLPWARDSLSFEVSAMQARTGELAKKVGPEQIVEAIGCAALGNTLVRLAMIWDLPAR